MTKLRATNARIYETDENINNNKKRPWEKRIGEKKRQTGSDERQRWREGGQKMVEIEQLPEREEDKIDAKRE